MISKEQLEKFKLICKMEDYKNRLKRFQDGPPCEAIDTLLNSIDNFLNNEIRIAYNSGQFNLAFLGIHAVILTIADSFFDLKEPKDNYKLFLERFIDGSRSDFKFSKIAYRIHKTRNNVAHVWLAKSSYSIIFDYEINEGFKVSNGYTYINPKKYCELFLEAFSVEGKIWDYENILTQKELVKAKQTIIKKFKKS